MRPLRIGLVCPYSLDVPGGVQNHVRDLAECLLERGHEVSVLAPSEAESGLPAYVVAAGRTVPLAYNGSVGRLLFGPVATARTRAWLAEGNFDVVHVHEPAAPSLGMIAVGAAECPVVATFHMANPRSRLLSAASGILRPRLERLAARIAVSEAARQTVVQHCGGEPVIIPNGVYVERYRGAEAVEEWRGVEATVAFIGRVGEPRKGLTVLLEAMSLMNRSGLRLLVVGGGDPPDVPQGLDVRFLGPVDDATKARVLATADVYVAPNTGGESFGIVLVEAMAAGTCVLASDLPAFRAVLADGRAGATFPTGDAAALAVALGQLLDDPDRRARLRRAASVRVTSFDWSTVASRIEEVYDTVALR